MRPQAYTPLAPTTLGDGNGSALTRRSRRDHIRDRLLIVACAFVTVLSSVISLSLFLSGGPVPVADASSSSSTSRIRWQSTYTNIETVLSDQAPSFPPITNFPLVTLQLDGLVQRLSEDSRMRSSEYGAIYRDHQHIVVSRNVSTVAQFRHLDYGMEECRLTITIPTSDTGFDPAVILRKPANVDIWFLNNSQELNPAMHGSWAPVASRIGFYTTLSLPSSDSVEHMTPAFACPSGGFTTVELACATTSPDCYLDFWQRPSSTGFMMTQNWNRNHAAAI